MTECVAAAEFTQVAQLVSRRTSRRAFAETVLSSVRSASFLGYNVMLFMFVICALRRRVLSVYMLNQCSEIVFNCLRSRNIVHDVPHGEGCRCLLRYYCGYERPWQVFASGLVAGLSMAVSPNTTLALYLTWKLIEAVVEPHNMRPSYAKFLNDMTGDRLRRVNRHPLEVLGFHCSSVYPDYFPQLDLRYVSRHFVERVLVWS
ncbi:hypothetical protein HPB50_016878 [Hyalomma asiaticum]|uniref:Uncharacterized protein n=1 Tax=Hyalomma asiaticum TaxID=266040 RepID=A0ACB7S395_HYAAI|nr:hypothetical protein HPB50_016878 [Hyalomma asiaticum]